MVIDSTTRQQRWAQAPLISLQSLTLGGPILVVAPHPDDETIGCGGLVCRAIAAGIAVHVSMLTDGAGSHPNSKSHPPQVLAATRRMELESALGVLGVPLSNAHIFNRPDGMLAATDDGLVASLAQLILDAGVQAVFCTWGGDSHPDHRATQDICMQAAGMHPTRVWAYPVWGKLHDSVYADQYADSPAFRFELGDAIQMKMRALACHASQLGQVIQDDPTGFALTRHELDALVGNHEVFIRIDH